jgi:hypothetical protein
MDVKVKQKNSLLKNEKGLATVETVPLLLVFVILLAYSFGSFGVIHTGVLNSIAARTYAFETFRNRANVTYFRDSGGNDSSIARLHFKRLGNRIHGIQQEVRPGEPAADEAAFKSTERPLRIGFGGIPADASRNTASIHNERVFSDVGEQRQTQVGVSPVWVMTQYGICITAQCGGN